MSSINFDIEPHCKDFSASGLVKFVRHLDLAVPVGATRSDLEDAIRDHFSRIRYEEETRRRSLLTPAPTTLAEDDLAYLEITPPSSQNDILMPPPPSQLIVKEAPSILQSLRNFIKKAMVWTLRVLALLAFAVSVIVAWTYAHKWVPRVGGCVVYENFNTIAFAKTSMDAMPAFDECRLAVFDSATGNK